MTSLQLSEICRSVSWRAFWDCALAGALGILTGFAAFVLTWEEETSVPRFLLILLFVALFAYAFEHIRDVIDDHEHDFSLRKSVGVLFLVAIFELFVTALHAAMKSSSEGWLEIGNVVLGPTLSKQAGPLLNAIIMAFLWVILGAALAAGLSLSIGDPPHIKIPVKVLDFGHKGVGATTGLLAGAVGAPGAVLLYVLAARLFIEIKWMLWKSDEWSENISNLYDRIPSSIFTWPFKMCVGLVWEIGHRFHSAWGPILALSTLFVLTRCLFAGVKENDRTWLFWSIAASPIVILGLPLLGGSILGGLKNAGTLLLFVAVVWGVPGLLLGLAVPYLRRPSENRKAWALTAWVAACLLALFISLVALKWILILAGLLILIGWAFWSGARLEDYWSLVAACVATVVLGVTQITLRANFLNIQELSSVLVTEPLGKISPSPSL